MGSDNVNTARRRFLTGATTVVGIAGAVGIAVPFVGSWNPSAKAKAAGAPVKADVSKVEPGAMIIVEWRGMPVYVVNRTESMLAELPTLNDGLKDPDSLSSKQPDYIEGLGRSIKPNLLVVLGLCTHLGCAPKYRPEVGAADLSTASQDWLGGFFCPCHGSKFDLSGRVYADVPAPTNLEIPPHSYEADGILVVGVDSEASS